MPAEAGGAAMTRLSLWSDVTNGEQHNGSEADIDCRRQPEGRRNGVNHTMSIILLYVGLDVHAETVGVLNPADLIWDSGDSFVF